MIFKFPNERSFILNNQFFSLTFADHKNFIKEKFEAKLRAKTEAH